jgi:ribosomal 50S subunit-recycling heat shock protein
MRLDLYLKQIGVLKRRALSKETIEKNRVRVNDQIVKPSYMVKPQDRIDIYFKHETVTIRVLNPILNYETIPQPKTPR